MRFADKLTELGLVLPPTPQPVAAYVPAIRIGNIVHVSGQLPRKAGVLAFAGQVPSQVSIADAQECARICFLNGLSAAASVAGGLSGIVRLIQINGFVQSSAGFTDHPSVIDGASQLALQVLGEAGKHARTAIGVSSLPFDAPVEISFLFEVHTA